mgnify:CR=1 FL=1
MTRVKPKYSIDAVHDSILSWLVIIFVVLFHLISPYYKGLFNGGTWQFEAVIYKAVLWSSIVLFIASLLLFKSKQPRTLSDQLLSIGVWLIPASCMISVVNAASYHLAMNSVYISAMNSTFFIVGLYLTRTRHGLVIISNSIVFSGNTLVLYGILIWFGNASYNEAILDGRLSNVFQYPNTYAAFLIGLLVSNMLLAGYSKKWYMTIMHGLMFLPILLSIFLTSSRGGLLVLPVIFMIYICLLNPVKQILNILYVAITGFLSLIILSRVTNIGIQLRDEFKSILSLQGWFIIIALSFLIAALTYLINKHLESWLDYKLQRFPKSSLIRWLIPLGLMIVALIGLFTFTVNTYIQSLLPEFIQQRINSLNVGNSSILSRSTFIKDSLELIKDYLVIGAGGGAWSSLYQVYQSYAYTSSQTHNFFLQYLAETGVIGSIIFICLLIYVFVSFLKRYSVETSRSGQVDRTVFFIIATTIFVHSLIDFDLSYVYISGLVFFCLGGMCVSPIKDSTHLETKWWIATPIFMAIVSIVILIGSFRALQGSSLFEAVLNDRSGEYNVISKKLDKALKYAPKHPTYVETKVDLLKQAYTQTKQDDYYLEAQKLLNNIKYREPFNRRLLNQQYDLFIIKGEMNQALEVQLKQIKMAPWDITPYEKTIVLLYDLGYQAQEQGSTEETNKYWNWAVELYNDVLRREEQKKVLPKYQQAESSSFRPTAQLTLSIGQIYYMREDYVTAAAIIKSGRISNDFTIPINVISARWYLASLWKLGKNHDTLYSALLEYSQEEESEIRDITALTP